MRFAILGSWLGCDLLVEAEDVADAIGGLTNPLVAQGVILAVEPAQDPDAAALLEGSAYAPGTGATVFLADAKSAADLANAPVTGGTVSVGGVAATDAGDGSYLIEPSAGLTYTPGASWTVSIAVPETDPAVADVVLPARATFTVPDLHVPGADLEIDLTGQGFTSALGVLLDSNGALVWSNEPQTIEEVYEASGNYEVASLLVPGADLATDGVYLLGVAGLVGTTADQLSGMNTALSNVSAGQIVFKPLTVGSLPAH